MSWFPPSAQLSSLCGALSICSWLFAQLPQVVANFRNRSAASLSLPFLISWACGDTLNLIGCILTHQLPFQTYLATYFVAVDCILVSQYFYYSRSVPDSYTFIEEPEDDSVFVTPAHDRPFSWASSTASVRHQRERSTDPLLSSGVKRHSSLHYGDGELRDNMLSNASTRTRSLSASISEGDRDEEDDELDNLRESWHSDMSQGRGRVKGAQAHWRPISSIYDDRLPTIADSPDDVVNASGITITPRTDETSQAHTTQSNAKTYLAVFALFSFGSLQFHLSRSDSMTSTSSGRVLYPRSAEGLFERPDDDQFVLWVGRLSAWVCTSFYLMSRFPQILKNFQRRSIAGLSILLFVMAFGGNLFYVLSIALSPERLKSGYWWEELPYLLGSGGTLGGDAIIVGQFWAWGTREEKSWGGSSSGRSRSRSRARRSSSLLA